MAPGTPSQARNRLPRASRKRNPNPLQSGPSPGDIADAVNYLMTANSVTGQIIYVDSGERFLARSRDVVFETED